MHQPDAELMRQLQLRFRIELIASRGNLLCGLESQSFDFGQFRNRSPKHFLGRFESFYKPTKNRRPHTFGPDKFEPAFNTG